METAKLDSENVSKYITKGISEHLSILLRSIDDHVLELSKKMGRLKKSPRDYLIEHNLWNSDELSILYVSIKRKECTLPSSVRNYIVQIVAQAGYNYFHSEEYRKLTIKLKENEHEEV